MPITHQIKPLNQDITTPANMYDPELTYYADGTVVIMRWVGGEKHGTTFGMSVDSGPYQFQAVRWTEGGEDLIAPQVLHRATETAS